MAEQSVDWWLTTEDLPPPHDVPPFDSDGHAGLDYKLINNSEAEGL